MPQVSQTTASGASCPTGGTTPALAASILTRALLGGGQGAARLLRAVAVLVFLARAAGARRVARDLAPGLGLGGIGGRTGGVALRAAQHRDVAVAACRR